MTNTEISSQEVEHVYLIGPPGNCVAKIGRTEDLKRRFPQIQNMSPTKLALLWSTPGGRPLERALHRHFDPIRLHGEWFDFSPNDPVTEVQEALGVIVVVDEPAPKVTSRHAANERDRRRAKLMPVMKPGAIFTRDPSRSIVPGWSKWTDELPNYVPRSDDTSTDPSEARCWCGHQIGSHDSIRPHACGGSTPHGPAWSDCLCLGYEGPLPVNLANYDLPGHNWELWKRR